MTRDVMPGSITLDAFTGWPGVNRRTAAELVAAQPRTVLQALGIRGVGRKTARRLLQLGLLIDPDAVLTRARTREELGLPAIQRGARSARRVSGDGHGAAAINANNPPRGTRGKPWP